MSKADRAAREAAALRANLLKRKEQSRLRSAPPEGTVSPVGDSDGFEVTTDGSNTGDDQNTG